MSAIDESNLKFEFLFENPKFVSQDERPDVIKLTFLNTPFYLSPED